MARLLALSMGLLLTTGCITGPPHHDDHGLYIGVGGNYAVERFGVDSGITQDDAPGVSIRGGYRFNPRFAAEVDIEVLDDFGTRLDGAGSADLEAVAGTVNAKVYAHSGLIQPYGIVGVGLMGMDTVEARNLPGGGVFLDKSDDIAVTFRTGVGVEVHDVLHGFLHHAPVFLFADVSYWWPTDELMDYRFVLASAGLALKFGGHGHGEDDHAEESHE